MTESLGTATLELEGDLTKLGKTLKQAETQAKTGSARIGKEFSAGLKKALLPAVGALGLLVVGAVKSVNAASDLGEQINKATVVFRGSEKQMISWSETTASALGISQRAALEAAGVFGNMLVPMGLAREEAGDMSRTMVELAADMASFNNADPSEVLDSLRAGLAGETEPLRRFGVFLNQARIEEEALRMGLVKQGEKLDAAAKAQATYSIILKDTTDAQGDFARTSDSMANSQRIMKAEVEDLAAQLGMALLPAMQTLLGFGLSLVQVIGDNQTEFMALVTAAGILAGGIILMNASLAIYNAQLLTAIGLSRGLRIAMATTPWGAAIVGAGLLAEWLIKQKDAANVAEDAQRNLTDAIRDYHNAIKEGENARRDLHVAELRLESAEISVKRAVQERTRVEKDHKSTLLDRREADLRVAQAMQERRDAEAAVAESSDKVWKSNAKLVTSSDRAKFATEGLAQTYTQKLAKASGQVRREQARAGEKIDITARLTKMAKDNANEYAQAARNMASALAKSNPKLAATANLAADLAQAWGRVVSLPEARNFVARFKVITTVEEHRATVGRNAAGTDNWPGGLSWVGERGPELVDLPQGAAVHTATESKRMAAGGGVHFHFDRYVGNKRELMADVKSAVESYRRQNGGRDPF